MSKLAIELTLNDFREVKIWECHGEHDATALVEPSLKSEISEDDGAVYLAATEFRLADDTILRGFSSPADDSGLDYIQPVVFHREGQLRLWSDEDGLIDISQELGKKRDEVFPIRWQSLVSVDGNARSGYIE